jgi:putative SOS response-associated peptidase YedK
MCTTYRATRADVEHVAGQAGVNLAIDFDAWKPDIWPDYVAPAVVPAGDSAAAELGVYGFWPKFLQPERRDAGGRKQQPYSTVNARGEEVGSKRLYAAAWRGGQRCLIPAGYVVEPCW